MALIDKTYFVGELNIPGTGTLGVQERLTFFIAKYEKELLLAILGVELYEAFTAGTKDKTEEQIDQKWKDLRDGKTYTAGSNKKERWGGLRDTDTKQSPIAAYVYFWWLRDKESTTTELGETTEKEESTKKAKPDRKQCRAWNDLARQVRRLVDFLTCHVETYPEWKSANACAIINEFRPINTMGI